MNKRRHEAKKLEDDARSAITESTVTTIGRNEDAKEEVPIIQSVLQKAGYGYGPRYRDFGPL